MIRRTRQSQASFLWVNQETRSEHTGSQDGPARGFSSGKCRIRHECDRLTHMQPITKTRPTGSHSIIRLLQGKWLFAIASRGGVAASYLLKLPLRAAKPRSSSPLRLRWASFDPDPTASKASAQRPGASLSWPRGGEKLRESAGRRAEVEWLGVGPSHLKLFVTFADTGGADARDAQSVQNWSIRN